MLYALNLHSDELFNSIIQFNYLSTGKNSSTILLLEYTSSSSSCSQPLPSTFYTKCFSDCFTRIKSFISHNNPNSCIVYLLGEVPAQDVKKIVHGQLEVEDLDLFPWFSCYTRALLSSVQRCSLLCHWYWYKIKY